MSRPRPSFGLEGSSALFVAAAVVVIPLLIALRYRLFFLVSVLIGLMIAGGLALWHRLHPIKDLEVQNKRPLGL
jgi:hypothetical protein